MSVVADLTEQEKFLLAIIQDQSGIDAAEFCWTDDTAPDSVFRAWDFQYNWYRTKDKFQIDQCGRAVGKSNGIQMRAFAFPFTHPSADMLITAPEMIHLEPVTKAIEDRIKSVRLGREFLKKSGTSDGFTHRPFEAKFRNNAKIVGRIPQKDGKGVKGCIGVGTLILTRRGQIPVENVVAGDEVLTHLSRWRKVVGAYKYTNADGYRIFGGGVRDLVVSESHRMWLRHNVAGPKRKCRLGSARWESASEIQPGLTFMGSPACVPAEPIPGRFDDPDVLRLVGRYVADGYLSFQDKGGTRTSGRVHIITPDGLRLAEVMEFFKVAGHSPTARRREHNGTFDVEASDTNLCRLIEEHFGRHADGKQLPVWLLGAPAPHQGAFLDGYLSGDGHYDAERDRWTASSSSKALAVGLKLLTQSLGYPTQLTYVDPKVTEICGRALIKEKADRSWRVLFTPRGSSIKDGDHWWRVVHRVEPVVGVDVFDLFVEEDHSYVADSLVSHNQHPETLEQDEAQDYPDQGWVELGETLKYGDDNAVWRAHGVSRGVRDRYYKQTQPESGWFVHKYTAMHRSDWTPEERAAKAELYGSRDHPDYRRNILGMHGDAQSSLFVLSRLMNCVDQNKDSRYNMDDYTHLRISEEKLRDTGMEIADLLEFPGSHRSYARTWIGMDVGMTSHPSEILVFGEEAVMAPRREAGMTEMRLRCLTRVHLERISSRDQRAAMERIWDFYRPQGFGMDRTGLGLPIYSEIMEGDSPGLASAMRAYNFSEKIVVGYEKTKDGEIDEDHPYGVPIMANVLEYSSDMLRVLVDGQGLILPWDIDMLREFQGQTYVITRSNTDAYGKKQFNKGKFHALDAARMATLCFYQERIDMLKVLTANDFEPVFDEFLV